MTRSSVLGSLGYDQSRVVGWSCLAVVLVLLSSASPVSAQSVAYSQPMWSAQEQQLTSRPGDQYDPSISGNTVVYASFDSGEGPDVWATDLTRLGCSDGWEFPIVVAPGDQELARVSGDVVVYNDLSLADVIVHSLSTGETTNLTAAAHSVSLRPAVDGDLVAWEDRRDGELEIYALDLSTGEERRVTDAPAIDTRPAISDGQIVWERCSARCDIYLYDWATEITTQITTTTGTWGARFPDIDGHTIVYALWDDTGERDIVAYDIPTGAVTRLQLPSTQTNPRISGDVVSFDSLQTGAYHIGLWVLSTGATIPLTASYAGRQFLADIDGNRVVYTDNRAGQLDIYMTTFSIAGDGDHEFTGFQAPIISDPAVVNSAKAGSAVPLVFGLRADLGLDVLTSPPAITSLACDPTDTALPVEATATSRSGLTYDADTDQYTYVWKTDKSLAGTCQLLTLTFNDGTSGTAQFILR
jgi:beta propeller repeat protein